MACFITRLVVSNNLQIDDGMMSNLMHLLTETTGNSLSLRDHSEKEQSWLELLNGNKLTHLNLEQLLKMALESKCYRVAENLYERLGDYSNILDCYLKDEVRKSEVFNYILTHINTSERLIQEQFMVNFAKLIDVNYKKTSEIVIENSSEYLEQFNEILQSTPDLQYNFIHEIVCSDLKLPSHIAEQYLIQLCERDEPSVVKYVQNSTCRQEQALQITRQYQVHAATALLLEQAGEWMESLEILLEHDLTDDAVGLCIRGAEHLDNQDSQKLWLKLLQEKGQSQTTSLRQLLHAAAPHVPPAQLLELVSNANFGDVKVLLRGMLSDYTHDVNMLSTTLKLLGKDLHHGQ